MDFSHVASSKGQVQEQSSRFISQQDKCPMCWQPENKFWSGVRDHALNVCINMGWQYHTCGLTWCGQVLGGNLLSLHAQHKWLLYIFIAFKGSSLQGSLQQILFIYIQNTHLNALLSLFPKTGLIRNFSYFSAREYSEVQTPFQISWFHIWLQQKIVDRCIYVLIHKYMFPWNHKVQSQRTPLWLII